MMPMRQRTESRTPRRRTTNIGQEPPVIWLLALAVFGLVAVFLKPGAASSSGRPYRRSGARHESGPAHRRGAIPSIGPEQENNYLAEGMHEEIAPCSPWPQTGGQGCLPIPRSASDAKAIGESLRVDAIVTGSVRQAKGQLRVVKLVDTQTEANLWARRSTKPRTTCSRPA